MVTLVTPPLPPPPSRSTLRPNTTAPMASDQSGDAQTTAKDTMQTSHVEPQNTIPMPSDKLRRSLEAKKHYMLPKRLSQLFGRSKETKVVGYADDSSVSNPPILGLLRGVHKTLASSAITPPAITVTPPTPLYSRNAAVLSTRYNTETNQVETLPPRQALSLSSEQKAQMKSQLEHLQVVKDKRTWRHPLGGRRLVKRSEADRAAQVAATQAKAKKATKTTKVEKDPNLKPGQRYQKIDIAQHNKRRRELAREAREKRNQRDSGVAGLHTPQASEATPGQMDGCADPDSDVKKGGWFASLRRWIVRDSEGAGYGRPQSSGAADPSGSAADMSPERFAVWKAKEKRERKWYRS